MSKPEETLKQGTSPPKHEVGVRVRGRWSDKTGRVVERWGPSRIKVALDSGEGHLQQGDEYWVAV